MFEKLNEILRTSLRLKLIVGLLTIVMVMGGLSLYIGLNSINRNVIREAYENVNNSLKAIKDMYQDELGQRAVIIQYLSRSSEIVDAAASGNRAYLFEKLAQIKKEFGFDIVNVIKPDGTVLVRGNNIGSFGDSVAYSRYVRWVMEKRVPVAGSGILTFDSISREGGDLAEKTRIKVVPTPHARTRQDQVEDRALVLKTVAPIMQGDKMVGILYGAILLNNNDRFVDRFRRMIFKEESIRGRDVGTTTIFLGDVRVATNVMDKEKHRAVGTLISEEVYKQVFEQGRNWLGRAFVVDNWYLSGYSRLTDIDGMPLGMLYVGILKAKYDHIISRTTILFIIVILVMTGVALWLVTNIINNYALSLNRVVEATTEIAHGNYHTIDISPDDDLEIRELSEDFNAMVKAVEEKDTRLQELAEKTILRSEKLASIGRLASGIAHEINNPLTGILTFSSLMLEEMKGTPHEEDLKIIRDETLRCRKIVRGLLDFARDYKTEKTSANLNAIIEDALQLLEKHVNFHDIKIDKGLDPDLPEIKVDVDEMRSMINNLSVNAADAMPEGGRLSISTKLDREARQVIIRVADTGSGISPENMKRIFEPFFTTKEKGRGTGLGLPMTYGVVKRHNGTIDVKSKVGEGTEFIIRLPLD